MLPCKRYFKDIFCPYDKAKLCHRPYCHYKHVERDEKGENIIGVVEETEYLADTDSTSAVLHASNSAYRDLSSSSYVPTPVGKAIQPPGILKSSDSVSSSSAVPVYNPTPISKLKELNSSNSHLHFEPTISYSPEYSFSSRKKKKIEEYDPTEVKCVTKKCVTFADQSGIALDDGYAPAFSSDEEVEDTTDPPRFSDDDLENDNASHAAPGNSDLSAGEKIGETKEEDEIDEKNIDEFSLVDKILVDCKRNEKLLANFQKPISSSKKVTSNEKSKKSAVSKVAKNSKVQDEFKDVYDPDQNKQPLTSINKTVPAEKNDVYDCVLDFQPTPGTVQLSEIDFLNPSETSNESKKVKLKEKVTDPAKKLKSSDNLKVKTPSSLSTKEKKDKTTSKSVKSSKSDKSKSKEPSKHSSKKEDSKAKHDKHSEKSSTSLSKTEKHRSSKSEKSSSSNSKDSKIEKSKSVPSKTEKSSSKVGSTESSKISSKEAKLQDEKVSSSSIVKKSKHDHNTKHSSKSLESHNKNKPKDSDKSKNSKDKASKRKADDLVSEKHTSKEKSSASKKHKNDDSDDSSMDAADNDAAISLSSDSDSDTTEECWKIFNETYPEFRQNPHTPDQESLPSEAKAAFRDITIMQKKRFAHAAAATIKPTSVKKSSFKIPKNPSQVMLDRYTKIRELQKKAEEARAAAEQNDQKARGFSLNSPARVPEKKRITAVTNHSLLAAIAEKNRMNQSSTSTDVFSPLPPTVSKTLKVTQRVAHIPDAAVKARPIIPVDYGSKVPTVVRQKFLNAFIDEYLKFSSSEDEAYENALEEEKKAYQRSSSKAIYMNVASNALNRLRHRPNENADGKKSDGVSSTTSMKTVSHQALLNGPQAQRTSFSIERKKAAPVIELKGTALYEHLTTYLLNKEQLKENGFPFPHATEIGKAVIEGVYANKTQFCNDPFKRTCCRCQKTYYVNVDGDYVRDEECDFHWGRLWKRRVAGALESRYTCCQGDSESDGCCVGTGHVFEGSEAHALKGYVNTLPKTPPPDRYYGIYALDCEMCYTTAGVELTRISVIDPNMKPVYETFVKPQNKVLDYNTRFSGITEENLKNVRTTIRDVQAVLLCMFSDKSILIGHSLESDFKALKLFHYTVIDTSVVFPHKMGPPYKRALRTLMAEKLNKIIQNDVGGHDSCEDAISCMELMLWKVKEDLKGNR